MERHVTHSRSFAANLEEPWRYDPAELEMMYRAQACANIPRKLPTAEEIRCIGDITEDVIARVSQIIGRPMTREQIWDMKFMCVLRPGQEPSDFLKEILG